MDRQNFVTYTVTLHDKSSCSFSYIYVAENPCALLCENFHFSGRLIFVHITAFVCVAYLHSTFCSRYLNSFTEPQLVMYDHLINKPSNEWDIFYWATGC